MKREARLIVELQVGNAEAGWIEIRGERKDAGLVEYTCRLFGHDEGKLRTVSFQDDGALSPWEVVRDALVRLCEGV
jgi:hypothetical protein